MKLWLYQNKSKETTVVEWDRHSDVPGLEPFTMWTKINNRTNFGNDKAIEFRALMAMSRGFEVYWALAQPAKAGVYYLLAWEPK